MGRKIVLSTICLCLIASAGWAQVVRESTGGGPTNYDRRWAVVDSLTQQGRLTRSALAEVNRIYAAAKKEKNASQEIKALVYRVTLEEATTENDTAVIREMERKVGESVQPSRSILQSVLARQYWSYLRDHEWQINDRTTTSIRPNSDFTNWTSDDLHRHIRELFQASLRDDGLLKRLPVNDWAPVLLRGNSPDLRPTLFDLLAHEALDYFSTSGSNIDRPEQVFEVTDPVAFADASTFVHHEFTTPDTSSPQYQSLLLYQRLLKFHLSDSRPEALIDADIDRLEFARNYSVAEDKVDLYLRSLTRLTDQWGDKPAAAQAWYLLAKHYSESTPETSVQSNSTGWDGNIRAKAICERVLTVRDSSEGKMNCRQLLDQLLQPKLDFTAEQFNLPGQPFRCLVTWSNVHRVFFRLVRIDSLHRKMSQMDNEEEEWRAWLRAPASRQFTQDLPTTSDYRSHSAEIAVGSIPSGTYALIGSTDAGWDRKKGVLAGQVLYITTMAYIREGRDYFVVNRETGQPLNDVRAEAWHWGYSGSRGTWQLSPGNTYHTDQQGHFRVQTNNQQRSCLQLQRPGEDIFLSDLEVPYDYRSREGDVTANKTTYERGNATGYFFLDRAIYRPGQPVYFKAITITNDYDTRKLKPVAGRHARVFLNNANNEKVDSLDVVSDDYGAYHGVFHLPDHGLNGRFRITDEYGRSFGAGFSVEEYKRPRFFVSFEPVKSSYRVGDSVRIFASAKAYAGNSLDGAKVKFRIRRMARYDWNFWRRRPPAETGKEIAHGELKTGGSGQFRIGFIAQPDRSLPIALDPRFDYQVSADVTDINGETRSASTVVVAGYAVLDLSIDLGQNEVIPADSLRSVRVDIKNLSGEPVASSVHVAAYPLSAPDRLIRERLWGAVPDRWVMAEEAFLDSFPHDQYREELNKEKWLRGPAAWEGTNSSGSGQLSIHLQPGWWMIEATAKDSFGQPVKNRRFVQLYDETGPTRPEYVWGGSALTNLAAKPGEVVRVETGSSARDVYVIREVQRPDTLPMAWRRQDDKRERPVFDAFRVSTGRHVNDWKITATDRGGFAVADAFVKDNRIYVHRTLVDIPWANKELNVHYRSFRDKTEPGSSEKWTVDISGSKIEPAAAQVLASMYDASLDQFEMHSWTAPFPYPRMTWNNLWQDIDDFANVASRSLAPAEMDYARPEKQYDRLIEVGITTPARGRFINYFDSDKMASSHGNQFKTVAGVATIAQAPKAAAVEYDKVEVAELTQPPPIQIRTNLQETAFFFPDLRTDSAGAMSFSFTMPESLTQWKWMTLAHTRDLAFGYSEKTIVTQKQLMIQPNLPRFLREGDKINLSVKVVNLTDSEMTGQMALSLTDPTTGETADGQFLNRQPNQYFTAPAKGSAIVEFPLDIPYQYNRPVGYRIVAEAGGFSDGEAAVIPVVSNRMMVTETLPLNMPSDGTRSFTFTKLLKSESSETLNHHALTVEFTANPAWYAVQALPYLIEYPYECAEQTFDRLYANAVASKIVNGSPRIAQIFERWRTIDTSSLLSNLEKNQELKSVLLEETPWVLEGKTETQQKKNIALLFDLVKLNSQLASTVAKLQEVQEEDGGFPWFKDGPEDRYITQYILTGMGRLLRLQALSPDLTAKVRKIAINALKYADERIREDYRQDLKVKDGIHWISPSAAQYLYMRSYFDNLGIPGASFAAVNFYRKLAQQQWVKANKYTQGMVALALFRTGDVVTARNILASLRETATRNEELGMHWKEMEGGYYWYQAPVETESLLIEAFREIAHDTTSDRQLKTWLLRQKQTHRWATTKATADAVYALLSGTDNWLDQQRSVSIQLGDKTIDWPAADKSSADDPAESGEAATGYHKKIFDAPFINPTMGHIKVTTSSTRGGGSPAWGAVYWQYFDQLDHITPADGGKAVLKVTKRLFIRRNTDRGPVLDTIPDNGTVHVGDRVVVRIVLRADRDLEYVHLKDMRGACFEPINVLSEYKWQDGLGYYETTKDVSSEFFFSSVSRGTYVFEYPMVVEQTGEFSNGMATVECLYAPEFADHTEGIRVNVEGGQ